MIGNETDKIINEIFQSLLSRCRICLEESMKGSEFDFDFFSISTVNCSVAITRV